MAKPSYSISKNNAYILSRRRASRAGSAQDRLVGWNETDQARRINAGLAPYTDKQTANFNADAASFLLGLGSFVPGTGDAAGLASDAYMYKNNPEERTLKNAVLTGLGALPFMPSASQIKNINSIAEIRELLEAADAPVYVRWSSDASHDLKPGAASRDYMSGETHGGLSAVPLDADMTDAELAKFSHEYGFLRMKDPSIKPHLYFAEKVGTDSDGYDLIKPIRQVGIFDAKLIKEMDKGLPKKLQLMEQIQDAERRLQRITDPMARHITEQSLSEARQKLSALHK